MFAAAHLRYKPHAAYTKPAGGQGPDRQSNSGSAERKTTSFKPCDTLAAGGGARRRRRYRPASVLLLLSTTDSSAGGSGGDSADVARLIATTALGAALPGRRADDNGDAPLAAAARRRAGSMPALKLTLAVAWNLRPNHVRALKITWKRLCDTPRSNCRGIIAIMERVFEKFESKEKTLKDVFYRSAFVDSMADCAEHSRMLRRRRSPLQRVAGATAVAATSQAEREAQRTLCAAAESMNSIATLRDHIHFFVSLISQLIQSLQAPPQNIFEHVDRIGCYHLYLKQYGFRASMWDKLGVCLIDGLVVQDCVRGFPEACRAWTIMVAALIDRLRSAPRRMPPAATTAAATAAGENSKKPDKIVLMPSSPDICRRSSQRPKSRGSSLSSGGGTSPRGSLAPDSAATRPIADGTVADQYLIGSPTNLSPTTKMSPFFKNMSPTTNLTSLKNLQATTNLLSSKHLSPLSSTNLSSSSNLSLPTTTNLSLTTNMSLAFSLTVSSVVEARRASLNEPYPNPATVSADGNASNFLSAQLAALRFEITSAPPYRNGARSKSQVDFGARLAAVAPSDAFTRRPSAPDFGVPPTHRPMFF